MLNKYLKNIHKVSLQGDAREESYYSALEKLLYDYADSVEKKNIHITSLPKKTEAGNPDFRVWDGKQKIVGYIEAKTPPFNSPLDKGGYRGVEYLAQIEGSEGLRISTPADVLPLIQNYADRKQEHFICVSINGANEVIKSRVVSVGLVNKTQVHPREVFADPITDRASGIIVAHNHPSGSLTPSMEDKEITEQLKSAGETLGIRLLDHIIFNHKGYYSFLESGEL